MPEHVLVTGGAGFVGSSLAIAIKRRYPEARVTAFDNLHRRGAELNLPRLRAGEVDFVHGDVRAAADLAEVAPAPDLILDCSAEPSAQAGYAGSLDYLIHTNLLGCYHVVELARKVKADLLFLSTSRVYPYRRINELNFLEEATRFTLSDMQTTPGSSKWGIGEDFPLDGGRSLYGMTKLASERMIEEYGDAFGLRYIINRCGLITGPWQMGKVDQGVIVLWVAAHYFRHRLAYIGFGGTGKQVRDVLHIDDLADLVLDQIAAFPRYAGRIFNAGGGLANSVSLVEATRLCREITGNSIPIEVVPETRPADVRCFLTDHRRLSAVAGWQPRRNPRETIADIFAWLRAEEATLKPVLLNE